MLGIGSSLAMACGALRRSRRDTRTEERARALIARGDTMILAGRLFGAESAYYAAARIAPHDGAARLALGRYLAGRGRLRIAATLMEEARHFGAEPQVVALDLAPVYSHARRRRFALGADQADWSALAALPSPVVGVGERLRAEYLRANPPAIEGPDSAIVLYTVSDSHLLGRIKIVIGGDTVSAIIDARVSRAGARHDVAARRQREALRAARLEGPGGGVRRGAERDGSGRSCVDERAGAIPGAACGGRRDDRARSCSARSRRPSIRASAT